MFQMVCVRECSHLTSLPSPCISELLLKNRHHIDIFLAVITPVTKVGSTRWTAHPLESVLKVHEVSFYVASSVWDDLSVGVAMGHLVALMALIVQCWRG